MPFVSRKDIFEPMQNEEQKFHAQSPRKQLRALAQELRVIEEILSGAPNTEREAAQAAFAHVITFFTYMRSAGRAHYSAALPRWQASLRVIERMFGDGTREQAIIAALNTLRHSLAEQAELPVGEETFLVRTNDRQLPGGQEFPCVCILDNLRSAFNCGSLMRSAEGLGAAALWLTGISPGPDNAKVVKTAMGAQRSLRIRRHDSLAALIAELKQQEHCVYALETAEGARSLCTETLRFPACVILGNEEYGLDAGILSLADRVIEIPMFGRKNSLNVAVSGSIFLYEARKQWGEQISHTE